MPGSTQSRVEIDNLGIPPLAGICSYEAAARPGLPLEQTVLRLKRYNYVLRRLYEVGATHLAATPEWERLRSWRWASRSTSFRSTGLPRCR
jgi:hypothetical protein